MKTAHSVKINKSKIRGEVSEGMICAEDEISLGTSHDGIMVLDPDAVPGEKKGTTLMPAGGLRSISRIGSLSEPRG